MNNQQEKSTSTRASKVKHAMSYNPYQKKLDCMEQDTNAFQDTRSSESSPWIPQAKRKQIKQETLALPEFVKETLKKSQGNKRKYNVRKILNIIFSMVVGFIGCQLTKQCLPRHRYRHLLVGLIIFLISYLYNTFLLKVQKKIKKDEDQ